jgi:hypothetical protein
VYHGRGLEASTQPGSVFASPPGKFHNFTHPNKLDYNNGQSPNRHSNLLQTALTSDRSTTKSESVTGTDTATATDIKTAAATKPQQNAAKSQLSCH